MFNIRTVSLVRPHLHHIDRLVGGSGSGNNILNGGVGTDILIGGVGNDTYRFAASYGYDIIDDQGADTDKTWSVP